MTKQTFITNSTVKDNVMHVYRYPVFKSGVCEQPL